MTTYFISGHGNVTDEEFAEHYEPAILEAVQEPGTSFVIGDFRGVDMKAQQFLRNRNFREVTIYHMFETPRINGGGWLTRGGFQTDDERDAAMTAASHKDIAWLRDPKRNSGTRRNLRRRV